MEAVSAEESGKRLTLDFWPAEESGSLMRPIWKLMWKIRTRKGSLSMNSCFLAEQQDPIYHQEEKRELLERLSALVIQGMMQTETKLQEDDLEKAVEYVERLLKTQVVKSLRERIVC